MAKVSKRERKFLSKNVLPHKQKRRRLKEGPKKRENNAIAPPTQDPTSKDDKSLLDGVDAVDFLECTWLNELSAGVIKDQCVGTFDPDLSVLDPSGVGKGKRRKCMLSVANIQTMAQRAVDDASVEDLIQLVWSLHMSCENTCQGPMTFKVTNGSKEHQTLVKTCLETGHRAFAMHLKSSFPARGQDDGEGRGVIDGLDLSDRLVMEKADGWLHVGSALLSFLSSALTITMATSDKTNLLYGLGCMRAHVPLLFPFPILARRYLVALLELLASNHDQAVLSLTFLRLYELATSQAMPFFHDALKGVYWAYRKAARRLTSTWKTCGRGDVGEKEEGKGEEMEIEGLKSLSLLRECIAELYGVEKPSSYLHAYVFIHDLVKAATDAMVEIQRVRGKSKEAGPALRRARSWEFVQCLQVKSE
ncbi:unnamed protein product [Choristocarpus tenellus]